MDLLFNKGDIKRHIRERSDNANRLWKIKMQRLFRDDEMFKKPKEKLTDNNDIAN